MDWKPYIHGCIPLSLHLDSQKAMLNNDMKNALRTENYEKCVEIKERLKDYENLHKRTNY